MESPGLLPRSWSGQLKEAGSKSGSRTSRDVVERLRVSVRPRIQEAEHGLPSVQQLIVQKSDDRREDGRRAGSP
jgi:hypothetical protein